MSSSIRFVGRFSVLSLLAAAATAILGLAAGPATGSLTTDN